MARYADDQKRTTQQRIVEAAGKTVRQSGLAGPIRVVMKRAGLTNGAFYKHFASKDELLQATLAEAFARSRARWAERLKGLEGPPRIAAMIDRYLSEEHADDVADGCPVPCILTDLSRVSPSLQKYFSDYNEWMVEEIAGHLEGTRDDRLDRAGALFSLAIGALMTARAATTLERRATILRTARSAGHDLVFAHNRLPGGRSRRS